MRIRWTPAAVADLQSISDYLKEHHPHYRDATMRKLYGTIRELKQWPGRGRPGREDGTREILFPPMPFVAVYRVRETASKLPGFITRRRIDPSGLPSLRRETRRRLKETE